MKKKKPVIEYIVEEGACLTFCPQKEVFSIYEDGTIAFRKAFSDRFKDEMEPLKKFSVPVDKVKSIIDKLLNKGFLEWCPKQYAGFTSLHELLIFNYKGKSKRVYLTFAEGRDDYREITKEIIRLSNSNYD